MKRKEAEEQQIHFFPEPRAAIASVNGGLSRYPSPSFEFSKKYRGAAVPCKIDLLKFSTTFERSPA